VCENVECGVSCENVNELVGGTEKILQNIGELKNTTKYSETYSKESIPFGNLIGFR